MDVTRIPPLTGANDWLNSQALTPAELKGKIVLVNFWTYTCINWLRTLPYVRAWDHKYRKHGLVVIGVHTPEFPFEHDIENVRQAAADMGVTYPVAIDNDYAVWSAFANHYWPASYFVDATGHIVHHWFGEGGYEESETVIQKLLAESGATGFDTAPVAPVARGLEVPADWDNLRSQETYLGYQRGTNFASTGEVTIDQSQTYSLPALLPLNRWALSGTWTISDEAAVLNASGGRLAFRFHARDLNLVMGPVERGRSTSFRVFMNGRPPHAAHGTDVVEGGTGTVTQQRLYQLIRQSGPIHDQLFEIEFLEPGIQVLAFTFG
jgi:thiol-disulfide isomerase/thioredoxin